MPTLNPLRSSSLIVTGLISACLALSCGGKDGSEVNGGNGDGSGNGTGANGPVGGLDVDGAANGDVDESELTPDATCGMGTTGAAAIPAVVQLVVDTSGSMNWEPGSDENPPRGQPSKWDITSEALVAAVAQLPASVALGLSFYPNTRRDNPCFEEEQALEIALLGDANSMQRAAFNGAVQRQNCQGGTPTHAAFLFGADQVAQSTIEGRKFVLLITDGVPTRTLDCSGDGQNAVDSDPLILAADTASDAGISTFVIGSPGSEEARNDLSRIATAGGTATAGCSDDGPNYCHLDMTTATDFGAALAQGLAAVAGRIAACEYAVPTAPDGKMLDKDRVNVIYTQGDGTPHTLLHDDSGSCTSGWIYADDAKTKILLCGSACEAVKADPGAKIDLLLGCMTDSTGVPR